MKKKNKYLIPITERNLHAKPEYRLQFLSSRKEPKPEIAVLASGL